MARNKVSVEVAAVDRFTQVFEKLEAQLRQLNSNLQKVSQNAGELGKKAEEGTSKASKGFSLMNSKVVKVAAAVGGAVFALKQMKDAIDATVETAGQFEFLRTRLANMFGSIQEGNKVFQEFNDIAATTPFQLERVVEAGATLRAFMGDTFDPKFVKVAADLAAFMGVDIVEAASAMGRAFAGGAGAADILRERGILTLIKMRTGIQDLSKMTLPEFRKALTETFLDPKVGIIGATDKLSQTLFGLRSNFDDTVTRIKNAIGSVFLPVYKDALSTAIYWGNKFLRLIDKQSDKIREQQFEFNVLIGMLKNANLHEKIRSAVISEINSKYKDYIGNIDLEKASLEELNKVQEKANLLFRQRIQLMVVKEEYQAHAEEAKRLQKRIRELNEDIARQQRLVDNLQKSMSGNTDAFDRAYLRLQSLKKELESATKEFEAIEQKASDTQEELKKLEEQFGLTGDGAVDLVEKAGKSIVKLSAETKKQLMEQLKAAKIELPEDVAAQIISQYEGLIKQLEQLQAKAIINTELGLPTDDALLAKIDEIQTKIDGLKDLYIRAKITVEGDTEAQIKDMFEKSKEGLDEIVDNWFAEQKEKNLNHLLEVGNQQINETQKRLKAEMELRRRFSTNQWEWEKQEQLQQLEKMWNTLTKQQKKMLGGEEAYHKARAQIAAHYNYLQAQQTLNTISDTVRMFGSAIQAMVDLSGQQTEATKVLMMVQAIIDSAAAINRAFATLPTPLAVLMSVAIGAQTMANVRRIQQQNVPKPQVQVPQVEARLPQPTIGGGSGAARKGGRGFLIGGVVTSDTVPAYLAPGEAVISRDIVNRFRPEIEKLVAGEKESATPTQNNITVSPVFQINAVDSQSIEQFVYSPEFRDALASAIEDGILQLSVGGKVITVER